MALDRGYALKQMDCIAGFYEYETRTWKCGKHSNVGENFGNIFSEVFYIADGKGCLRHLQMALIMSFAAVARLMGA